MIGYITLGSNDLSRAIAFYDELLTVIGAGRVLEDEGVFVAWGTSPESPSLAATKPFDGETATAGNGTMVALQVESEAQVQALHAKALSLGGKDEGAPGNRGEGGFYAGYFRDLDGNKLNAFCLISA